LRPLAGGEASVDLGSHIARFDGRESEILSPTCGKRHFYGFALMRSFPSSSNSKWHLDINPAIE
jgi:hypothetical protein